MQKDRKSGSVWVQTGVVDCARRQVECLRSKGVLLALVVVLTVIAAGCKPFNVKPKVELRGAATEAQAEAGGVVIRASVVRDEDWLTDTFDANLILAGIVPVRVEVKNAGQAPIDLSKVRFELKTANGHGFGSVNSERAFKQALSYYDVSAWSKGLYKESRADFASYGLDTKTPAPAGESRKGLVYFLVPGDSARGSAFTLVVSRLPNAGGAKGEGRAEVRLD
ncbi:MAG: hypothetical protein AABO41_09205 [Acidobacteriota bacterium]